ncbi:hypothetical protein K1T71_005594 [Dendrolimus kikuchii]|uniref:Uncharacterized protein n=1 Tax=Dendrolimus kikuchii TaxID=765133 RepID=A0ACC1D4G0_9NEOP|nr:hypothetical protein K1T71_005594 [Dendrolimus kikuchii]
MIVVGKFVNTNKRACAAEAAAALRASGHLSPWYRVPSNGVSTNLKFELPTSVHRNFCKVLASKLQFIHKEGNPY